MTQLQLLVRCRYVAGGTVNAHHGDDGVAHLLLVAHVQVFGLQYHHAVGCTKQQAPVGQHGSAVF